MLRILHFADAHIDIARYGRHDPQSGLPVRAQDFLNALDFIVDTAIQKSVDIVLFSGDAYRDRTPVPTFQREWGKRMMRISKAGIRCLLLVGNHDISPAMGRAHALQEYETLQIPHIQVISRPTLLGPQDLESLPLQIIALPWISRTGLMANQGLDVTQNQEILSTLEDKLSSLINNFLDEADSEYPLIMMAHATIQGAKYGNERSVMLGNDLVLPPSLVRNPRIKYVALGHIHKAQDLNENNQPPVIYPGSIERVDFGEIDDDKFFVIAEIEKDKPTQVFWHKIPGRKFISCHIEINSTEDFQDQITQALPSPESVEDSVFRMIIEYPKELESLLDEAAIRNYAKSAFEFHLVRRPKVQSRVRLPDGHGLASLTPLEMLDIYWQSSQLSSEDIQALQHLAGQFFADMNA